RQFGRIRLEEHPVADIHHEILLAAGDRRAGEACLIFAARLVRAGGGHQYDRQNADDPCNPDKTKFMRHPGRLLFALLAPMCLSLRRTPNDLVPIWLSEGSVNLDKVLPRAPADIKRWKPFRMVNAVQRRRERD